MTISRYHIDGGAARNLLWRAKHKPLTYDAVGMSLGTVAPPEGFREYAESRVVGTGAEAFANIGYGLMHWDVHRAAGMFVQPEFNVVREGDAVAVAVHVAPFLAVAGSCRVTQVIATGRSIGWAYGTLPGHPECGEELFLLTHRDDDQVEMSIRAFSQPGVWYVGLAGPLGRVIQRRIGGKLLRGAASLATMSPVRDFSAT